MLAADYKEASAAGRQAGRQAGIGPCVLAHMISRQAGKQASMQAYKNANDCASLPPLLHYRWRKLEGSDPTTYEMILKIQAGAGAEAMLATVTTFTGAHWSGFWGKCHSS